MTDSVQIGVQLWPGGTPDYRTWREAVIKAEELGADAIFGYDHFHKPFTVPSEDGLRSCYRNSPTSTTLKVGRRWRRGPRLRSGPRSDCW